MRNDKVYWAVTILVCVMFTLSGIANLARVAPVLESVTALGYPPYLLTILGVAKLLAVVALLAPKWPILKEWAYAGLTFDMLGASASHAFSRDPAPEVIVPLVVLGILAASYATRPSARRVLPMADVRSD